jgi:hypothetical protein
VVVPIATSITGPHWLQAGRIVRRQSGLEETRLLYSLQSVLVEGSNVVSQAQQRFYVNREDDWQIKLLLYSVRVMARDAVFGSPLGTAVRVVYPGKPEDS